MNRTAILILLATLCAAADPLPRLPVRSLLPGRRLFPLWRSSPAVCRWLFSLSAGLNRPRKGFRGLARGLLRVYYSQN